MGSEVAGGGQRDSEYGASLSKRTDVPLSTPIELGIRACGQVEGFPASFQESKHARTKQVESGS